jgi:DNA-binding NarL/FixJ family response regulator
MARRRGAKVGPVPNVRVMVVDDDDRVRRRATRVLSDDGIEVAAAVDSYYSALAAADRADVAVADLRLGGKSGIELTREMTLRGVAVLVYTDARDRESLSAALQAGALGIALKDEPLEELPKAVRRVADGQGHLAAGLRGRLDRQSGGRLTPREREILFLLATGLTNEQVAQQLGLSPETTRTHMKSARRKLGAHTRVHAVVLAAAEGEITLP